MATCGCGGWTPCGTVLDMRSGNIFEAHILPSKFAKVRLADLTHLEISAFLRELEEKKTSVGKPLQANTINKILARVRTMINDAFESGEIASPRNPMGLVKNLTVPERETHPFEPSVYFESSQYVKVSSVHFMSC